MKGDFSTDRFTPSKHFNRVLKQQGRVEVDADWNEHAAISQHLLRALIVDLFGRAGGPRDGCGFGLADPAAAGLAPAAGDFVIGAGRYYVDGLLVENGRAVPYSAQPELPAPARPEAGKTYFVYLDVWERHITHLEDDAIREAALGGPDTTTRAKTTWQVKLIEAGADACPAPADAGTWPRKLAAARARLEAAKKSLKGATGRVTRAAVKETIARLGTEIKDLEARLAAARSRPAAAEWEVLLEPLRAWASGTLTVRLEPPDRGASDDRSPGSRYRGLENHLYRIEIHDSGDTADPSHAPTFKWSRDNGSVATRWLGTTGGEVRVAGSRGFAASQWVELSSETDELLGQPGALTRVTRVDGEALAVETAPAFPRGAKGPRVRRWDQTPSAERGLVNGAVPIVPGSGAEGWVRIEDGIEIQFSAGPYRSGDYWLIPARAATGAIDWPAGPGEQPLALPPRGIVHHYAPLFLLRSAARHPFVTLIEDWRRTFPSLPCGVARKT